MDVLPGIWFVLIFLRLNDCASSNSGAVVTPANVFLSVGEPGILTCNFSGSASLLFWTKGNTVSEAKVILSSDIPSTGELSGPGALEGRFDVSGYSLLILNVKKEDEGRYFCEITDKTTGVVSRSHIDVTTGENSAVVSVSTLDAVELTSGKEAVLPCSFPQPVSAVYWKRGESRDEVAVIIILDQRYGDLSGPGFDSGQFVIRDDFSLVIHNVQKEGGGRYFCEVVSSETGTRYDGFTDVTVIDPPRFYIDQCTDISPMDEDGFCSVNVPSSEEHITLDCSVTGAKGRINITWSTNDTASGILSSMSVRSENIADLTATLRERVDSIPGQGGFRCTADVNNGSYRWQFTVLPTQPSSSASSQADFSPVIVIVGVAAVLIAFIVALVILFFCYRRLQDGDKDDEMKTEQGPDPFDESLQSWASKTDERVRIRGKTGTKCRPITIPRRFERIKDKYPNHVALAVKNSLDERGWTEWTYQEYWDDCKLVAKGLMQLKIKNFQTVGICGPNSPEWVLTYMGSIMAGCVAVGLDTEFSVEDFWTVVDDCKPDVIVMEDTERCREFAAGRETRNYPKHLVVYNERTEWKEVLKAHGYDEVYSWSEFVDLGKGANDNALETIMAGLTPNHCCSITYPSKFSEEWKGCMSSHDNLTWLSRQCVAALNIPKAKGRLASYLPLHHVASQLFDIMVSLSSAGTTYFLRNEEVRSKFVKDFIKRVRPTTFLFIPHVLDSIQDEVKNVERGHSRVRKRLVEWSKRIGLTGTRSKWESKPWGWTVANFLLFRKIRFELGLDRCKCCLSRGSKLRQETLDFFLGIGLPIYDMYGMSESTGVLTSCLLEAVKSGSVGKTFPDSKIVVHNSDTAGNGEVCFYDRNLFMGYLNQEDATRSAHTEQGLFNTGDIGYRDSDGFLYLIGNAKDKITTATGYTIHPGPVEEAIKKTPLINDCMLIGKDRPYLTLIATLKEEEKRRNDDAEALIADEPIKDEIKRVMHGYNTSVATSWQQVKLCFLLTTEESIKNWKLSDLYKTKVRDTIEKNYRTEIEHMYQTYETRPAGVIILTSDDLTMPGEAETVQ